MAGAVENPREDPDLIKIWEHNGVGFQGRWMRRPPAQAFKLDRSLSPVKCHHKPFLARDVRHLSSARLVIDGSLDRRRQIMQRLNPAGSSRRDIDMHPTASGIHDARRCQNHHQPRIPPLGHPVGNIRRVAIATELIGTGIHEWDRGS